MPTQTPLWLDFLLRVFLMIAFSSEKRKGRKVKVLFQIWGKILPDEKQHFSDICIFLFMERLYFVLCLYTTIFFLI